MSPDRMPVLRAHLHRPRPRAAPAVAAGGTARIRARRLPECQRIGAGHSAHAAAADRAAGVALAVARQHGALLLSVQQVDVRTWRACDGVDWVEGMFILIWHLTRMFCTTRKSSI